MTADSDVTPPSADNKAASASAPWVAARSAKHRGAVQRQVEDLFDALAPERVLSRSDAAKVRIEPHRTPNGRVLQGPNAALSISWFADDSQSFGELHITVWSGVVFRRGAPPPARAASVMREMMLQPLDGPVWRATDGTQFDTPALAAHCLALLEEAIEAGAK